MQGMLLAMSGSVDDAGSGSDQIKERLSNSIGPEIKRYTITDARADGVIPSFDWEVHYAPYDVVGDGLEEGRDVDLGEAALVLAGHEGAQVEDPPAPRPVVEGPPDAVPLTVVRPVDVDGGLEEGRPVPPGGRRRPAR